MGIPIHWPIEIGALSDLIGTARRIATQIGNEDSTSCPRKIRITVRARAAPRKTRETRNGYVIIKYDTKYGPLFKYNPGFVK